VWLALVVVGLLCALVAGALYLSHRHTPSPVSHTGASRSPTPLAQKAAAFGDTIVLRDSFGANLDVPPVQVKPFPKAVDVDGLHDVVGVEMRLHDAGSAIISDDAGACMRMRDSTGEWHDAERPGVAGELDAFSVRPGRRIHGWVCFALPAGRQIAVLTYTTGSQQSDAYAEWTGPAGGGGVP